MTYDKDTDFVKEYDRQMLKSAFVSAFFAVFKDKKKREGFTLSDLTKILGHRNRSVVSKWFSGNPNWEIDTISDIAHALDVKVKITLESRDGQSEFSPRGKIDTSTISLTSECTDTSDSRTTTSSIQGVESYVV